MIRNYSSIFIGKTIKKLASLRGGGSALPGLVIEKIDPSFLPRILATIPMGVIVISGTNGKTTTTKIVTELLEASGLKVFTNRTGSNFPRGVAAALLGEIDRHGGLTADIAVLELDEAWAVRFVEKIRPRYSLLLNVMRDQLDRFAEIDKTAQLLEKVALATTDTVVINYDDFRLRAIGAKLTTKTRYYGMSDAVKHRIMSTDQISAGSPDEQPEKLAIRLESFTPTEATFASDDEAYTVSPALKGVYNLQNAAAALCIAREVLETNDQAIDMSHLVKVLYTIQPAFGRGETIAINDTSVTLLLVKNPTGFQLALQLAPLDADVMVAINDNFADGRDVSWLWDVEFSSLPHVALVSGQRAHDMAVRLGYDEVPIGEILPEEKAATEALLRLHPDRPKFIYCTYTAMLSIRQLLQAKVAAEPPR